MRGGTSARIALVAGAFWYELAGFAHKPLTEFVATALLLALLALCAGARSSLGKGRVIAAVAALAVFAAAIRLQYAPLALLLLGVAFLRTERKAVLALAAGVLFAAVGAFDALTWGGGLFHSYVTNIHLANCASAKALATSICGGSPSPAPGLARWLSLRPCSIPAAMASCSR